MVNSYYFGKEIAREIFPVQTISGFTEPLQVIDTGIVGYLFDSKPSRENAISGSGSIASASSFDIDSASPYPVRYIYAAITDPDPDGNESELEYYEAISFRLESGEAFQTVITPIKISRTRALAQVPGTNAETIKQVFPQVTNYLEDSQLEELLAVVEEHIKIELRSNGIEWANVVNLRVLKLALAYRCIVLGSIGQIKNQGDRHDRRRELFSSMYEQMMKAITLEQDLDGDGEVDIVLGAKPTHHIMSK